jgi:hypothetical protein
MVQLKRDLNQKSFTLFVHLHQKSFYDRPRYVSVGNGPAPAVQGLNLQNEKLTIRP